MKGSEMHKNSRISFGKKAVKVLLVQALLDL